jgi:chromate transport protein ChrA
MNEPERTLSTFHAFCSLLLPGLGQLLQKRTGAAVGFFILFIVSGFLPVLIVSLLFMDRFSHQPLRVHLLHIVTFGGLFLLFMAVMFWAAMDAAKKPEVKTEEVLNAEKRGCSLFFKLIAGIIIAGFVVALLLPAIPAAREPARRMQCTNHMKQIMIAFHQYHTEHGHLPPTYTVDEDGKPLHSWRVLILPYIEHNDLYEKIRLDEPWDSEYNRQFHAETPGMFRCPSASEAIHIPAPSGCYYSVIDGAESAFCGSQTRTFDDITAGTSNTIFLVERRLPVNWMEPLLEITFDTACKGVNVDAMGISSYHPGVAGVALGDGTVRAIGDTVDGELLRKMLTCHAEE